MSSALEYAVATIIVVCYRVPNTEYPSKGTLGIISEVGGGGKAQFAGDRKDMVMLYKLLIVTWSSGNVGVIRKTAGQLNRRAAVRNRSPVKCIVSFNAALA